MERINVSYNEKPCYDILINNSWDNLVSEVNKMQLENRKICIVTESNVGPLYAKQVRDELDKCCLKTIIFEFPAGEKSKNLEIVHELYEVLIKEKFDRNDVLVALGGGVVGDLTGFAAATYLRGIKFIQIPTSLLSQVDSSIGGKTGVDFKGYKNMVGAFKQPSLVFINLSTLKSLPNREFLSGMGEVIKYGFIKKSEFLGWLKDNVENIKNLEDDALEYMVSVSCHSKRVVVENDFTEKGERATLNFGHTLGHAVEKLKNFELLHGECVAIGMKAALEISYKKDYINAKDYEDGVAIIQSFDLPISTSGIKPKDIADATLNDKKMDSNKIKFILVNGIGNAIIDTSLTFDDILKAAENIIS